MERASRQIETTFVKGLIKLEDPLNNLSKATVDLVAKFTDKALPALMKDLGGAIDWLAGEVKKPEFVAKVEGLIGSIGSLAGAFGGLLSGLVGFARWLGISVPGGSSLGGATPWFWRRRRNRQGLWCAWHCR